MTCDDFRFVPQLIVLCFKSRDLSLMVLDATSEIFDLCFEFPILLLE